MGASPATPLPVHPEPVEGCARHRTPTPIIHQMAAAAALAMLAFTAGAFAQTTTPSTREQQLIRMVRQDCGSCHGMRLTGGLGPPLTPTALKHMPLDSVTATIFHGRPGTPMPPWSAMLDEREARWIAERLQAGFPNEATR